MSQVILISDNEVINSLYEVNLRAYVATNVTIKKSLSAARGLIEQSPNIDAVICFRELNDKDNVIDKFHEYLISKSLSIPVIVLGTPNVPLGNSIVISNKYDIQGLLQAMAKILEISAKDMADRVVPDYFPVPLKLFSQIEQSHCEIFYRNEKEDFEFEYYMIIEKDTPVSDLLQKYIDEGVEHLYLLAEERLRFINKASAVVVSQLDREDLTLEERTEITQQGMGIVAEEIFNNSEISEEIANISKACIDSVSTICEQIPKIKGLLEVLMESKAGYVYKHSVLSTYISNQIIKNISWGSAEQQNKVAFALFFHDIYLVPIYQKYLNAESEEDLLFNSAVSDEDKETILAHANLAGELVKTFPKCPVGADMIITQHHGMTSGRGFAVNFKDDISPLTKIIIIAEDVCSSILNSTSDSGPGKIKVNKSAIADNLLEKYRSHSYKKVIEAFRESKL